MYNMMNMMNSDITLYDTYDNMKSKVENHQRQHVFPPDPSKSQDTSTCPSVSPRPVAAKETSIPHGRQENDDIAKACCHGDHLD